MTVLSGDVVRGDPAHVDETAGLLASEDKATLDERFNGSVCLVSSLGVHGDGQETLLRGSSPVNGLLLANASLDVGGNDDLLVGHWGASVA